MKLEFLAGAEFLSDTVPSMRLEELQVGFLGDFILSGTLSTEATADETL